MVLPLIFIETAGIEGLGAARPLHRRAREIAASRRGSA
jgi:hypothetical protein